MSEVKFTPSPWKFNAHDGSITDCTKAENEIATAQLDDWHHLGMGYANYHLIAAAPSMYEYLSHMVKHDMINDHSVEREVKSLLAKARGE